ncbi:hypothetical protein WA026_022508 [Henosepilachna vigintioctopunctata]|uniref:UDP-glucuronosyltransferase n=1 Tax=Henosepilachna vigintioctopunctata TaxID=420089 RepID=A0AAW1UIV6_9CUCU
MLLRRQLIVYLFLIIFCKTDCANILGVFQMAGASHYIGYSTLMKVLAENGHNVTIVSAHKDKNPPNNYKEVILTGLSEKLKVLLNADPSVHEPQSIVPSMVNVGGFHIRKTRQLPNDLQEVLDNAKYGVIYFSMGSTLRSKDIPEDKLKILLETFSKLKVTVLLKLEGRQLTKTPSNVVIKDWFPQNDLLAHKNLKLFITHGGLFSVLEAVYHAVPILALPVFADQYTNSKRAAANGYAKFIPFREIDEENFDSYVNDMLQNHKYKKNIMRRSKILTDKPMTAAESVNYWVEYVIRHQGAPHLKVAALNLSWYQYILLDVIAFITALLVLLIYIVKKVFYLIFRTSYKKEKLN